MTWQPYYPVAQAPLAWRCESTGGSGRRIIRLADNAPFTVTTGASSGPVALTEDNCLPDVIRRAKQYAPNDQGISLEDGVQFRAPQIQGADSGKAGDSSYGYFGNSPISGFQPVQGLQFVSSPSNRAIIYGTVNCGSKVKAQNSIIYTETQLGGKVGFLFYGVKFKVDGVIGDEHFIKSTNAGPTSHEDVQGKVYLLNCTAEGNGSYTATSGNNPNTGGGYDCKTPVRMGFVADFAMMDCVWPTAGEHACCYLDAPQGSFRAWYNQNTSPLGSDYAICGRTAIQLVQRGSHPIVQSNYGGLPGFGTISIIGNNFRRIGWLGGSALTIAGFLGDEVLLENNLLSNCYSGHVVFWTNVPDGGFTTIGPFNPAPAGPAIPPTGTAWTTRRALVRGTTASVSATTFGGTPASTNNQRTSMSFRGVQEIEIEDFDITHWPLRPVTQFWGSNPANTYTNGYDALMSQDPLDNGSLLFRCPPVAIPVSNYSGWHGHAHKARYKNVDLSTNELNLLANRNSAYPPGGPPPPPPGTNLWFTSRGGSRVSFAGIFDATAGGRSFTARSGKRALFSDLFDSTSDFYFTARSGTRGGVQIQSPAQSVYFTARCSKRSLATAGTTGFPVQPQPPRPSRIYREAGEILTAGSEAGFIAAAGTAAGQVVTNDA